MSNVGTSKLSKFSKERPCISSVIVLSKETSKIGCAPKETKRVEVFGFIKDMAVTGNSPPKEASRTSTINPSARSSSTSLQTLGKLSSTSSGKLGKA